ncbi:hypothetical protein PP404_25085 [Mycobacteroides abscessus]|nr:hypothetical protein [Mycobacteroides abscessus]MDM2180498.1 hypothetical protein [Mycobacteroides abscessus]MDM2209714.1 hypothetical protein [Mycobacteroides abscessus]MDM2214740.1 hypothetical protein [Mycobacteroides abscessus]MDM2219731.1 hypothetical protein [Mycobacteroides abscessus]
MKRQCTSTRETDKFGDVLYDFPGMGRVPIPLFELCPDCSSSLIVIDRDYLGNYLTAEVLHDGWCPLLRGVTDEMGRA